ncbi:MAG: dialkylresorcinol condensing enzyme DarA [Flavobacteriales bacterium]|nr:dialkylresorcinol condensing enzyme DarA [Flavobacteriales bacterium]
MRILVLYYSQTGQLRDIIDHCLAPFVSDPLAEVDIVPIVTRHRFPFPWSNLEFFNLFPESVNGIPFELEPLGVDRSKDYDLIVLAYTVWFLQPSVPISSLLQHPNTGQLFKGRPVVTIIGSRNMWVLAQERVKQHLHRLGATLVGNIALTDRNKNLVSIITIIRWMFHGKKEAFWFFPPAGILKRDIEGSSRFGEILHHHAATGSYQGMQNVLNDAGAVNINPSLLLLEHRATKLFRMYARFISAKGDFTSVERLGRVKLLSKLLPLGAFILSPITTLSTVIVSILKKKALARQVDYHRKNDLSENPY